MSTTDRNLLFGILALQMDFINRDQLVAGMHAWVLEKTKALGQILVEHGVLATEDRALLETVVERHLAKHGRDARQSLAALTGLRSARRELHNLGDPDVQASLAPVSADGADPKLTQPEPTAQGGAPVQRFRILRLHARGGLGEVFVAEDRELHREVALKQIQAGLAQREASRSRFLMEAEITGGLEHPGIVPVYSLGSSPDGLPCYAMRFIRGESFQEAIERFHSGRRDKGTGRQGDQGTGGQGERKSAPSLPVPLSLRSLELRQLLRRFIDVCNAVAYAHSRGVLHRDLKPANVMLGKFGETLLVDWGLAKVLSAEARVLSDEPPLLRSSFSTHHSSLTLDGTALGTPAYMSPEQAAGRLDLLGPATDIYSLGAMLCTLLTGQPPVTGNDVAEVLRRVQAGRIADLRQRQPGLPRPLEAIVLKALALDPSDRYPTAQHLAAEIEHWLADEPVAAYREPLLTRARRWRRQHRTFVASGIVAVLVAALALAGFAGLVTIQNQQLAKKNLALQAANTLEAAAREREAKERARAEQITKSLVAMLRRPDPAEDGETVTLAAVLGQAAEQLTQDFADDPITRGQLQNAIGQTYYGLGLYSRAVQVFEQAWATHKTSLGAEHPDTLFSMNGLAMAHSNAGHVQVALPLLEKLLAMEMAKHGPDHLETLVSMNNLASAYLDAGQIAKALALHEETLRRSRAAIGSAHPHTARCLNNLGTAFAKAGQPSRALPLYQEALEYARVAFGSDHPHTLDTLNNLANAYQAASQVDVALPLFEEALRLSKARSGPDHPDTILKMNNLAVARQAAGQEAATLLGDALKLARGKLGHDHPRTLNTMNNLAFTYSADGRLTEAITLFEETLRLREAKHGVSHPDTSNTRENLATAYIRVGRLRDALPLLQDTLKHRQKRLGPDHVKTLIAMNGLATLLVALDQHAAAEELLLPCLAAVEKSPHVPPDARQRVIESLVRLYDSWGKAQEAESWARQLPPFEQLNRGVRKQNAWPLLWGWPRF